LSSRPLKAVDASDYESLRHAVLEALEHGGPAVFPVANIKTSDIPSSVPSEAVLLIETSGSSTRPKRVWHTAKSLRAAADQVNAELAGPGVWWQVLPGHYIAGAIVVVRAFRSGSHVVQRPQGHGIAESLEEFVTQSTGDFPALPWFTSLVPKQLSELIVLAQRNTAVADGLGRFSRILVGGQRVPDSMMSKARELGLNVTRTYGAAETAGGCVWNGEPLAGTEVDIVQNRVAISGAMLAGGYLGDLERTNRCFVGRDGKRWFVSDDVGEIMSGRLSVVGRTDRMIISGGEKTSLDEVEVALWGEYGTEDLAVISVPDATWGEAIGVISADELDSAEVERFLLAHFGKAARLAWTERVFEIPRLLSGKVDRQQLKTSFPSQPIS